MGTYTSRLALYKPAISETGWGALVNAGFDTIDTLTPSSEIDVYYTYGKAFTLAVIQAAMTDIGTSDLRVLTLRPGTWVIDLDADWSAYKNIRFNLVDGAELQIATGKTWTFANNPIAGFCKIYDCVGTGLIKGLTYVDPRHFGAVCDQTTDDILAWQKGFAAFGSEGGAFYIPDGSYVGDATGAQITWPNDGTKCYPIKVFGDAQMPTSGTYGSCGQSEVKYDGAGTLFDCTNGNDTLLKFGGCRIDGARWTSGSTTPLAGSAFIKLGDFQEGAIINNYVVGFDTGIWIRRYGYFSLIQNTAVMYCGTGLLADNSTDVGATFNGSTIEWCRFSYNNIGIDITRGGSPVNISHTWVEENDTYGLRFINCRSINLNSVYLENSGAETCISVTGDPYNSTQFSMFGGRIYHSLQRYAITFDYVPSVCIIGTEIDTGIEDGQSLRWLHGTSRGMIAANFGPRVNNTRLMTRSLSDGMITGGTELPIVTTGYADGKYVENGQQGDFLTNSFQLAGHGNKVGSVCAVPGAGSSVSALAGITATTTAASSVVTFNTTPSLLHAGSTITIAGETFTESGVSRAYARIAEFTSNTVASIHGVADTGVATAAVRWNPTVRYNIQGVQFKKDGTNYSTDGTTPTTLATVTVPKGSMGSEGAIEFYCHGTATGAAGIKTFTFYVGTTQILFMPSITAIDGHDWDFTAKVFNNAHNAQTVKWVYSNMAETTGLTTVYKGVVATYYDTDASDTVFKVTCECANAADDVTSTQMYCNVI